MQKILKNLTNQNWYANTCSSPSTTQYPKKVLIKPRANTSCYKDHLMILKRQDLPVHLSTESELNLSLPNIFGKSSDWTFAPSLMSRTLSPSFNLYSIPFFYLFKFLENNFQEYFILLFLLFFNTDSAYNIVALILK